MGINPNETPPTISESIQQLLRSINDKLEDLNIRVAVSQRIWSVFCIFMAIIFPIIGFGIWSKLSNANASSSSTTSASTPLASSLPTKVTGNGIFVNQEGRLFTINSRVDGIIKTIEVKLGDEVNKDQLLIKITDHEFDIKMAVAKAKYDEAKKDLEQTQTQINIEGDAHLEATKDQLKANEYNLEQQKLKILKITQDLEKKKLLMEQKLVSLSTVRDIEDQLSSAKEERESLIASIANLRYLLTLGYRSGDLQAKQDTLDQTKEDLEMLQFQTKYYQVSSPYNGQILELQVAPGDIISRGQALMLIERCDATKEQCLKGDVPLRVYAFVPLTQGKLIAAGDPAEITVSSVNTQKYGTMQGRVLQVTSFPVSNTSISKLILNSDLVTYLVGSSGPDFVVIIEPEHDPKNKKYKWSSGKEPPYPVTSGTVCTVSLTPSRG